MDIADLLTRPYQRAGRGDPGYDCWGLVRAILQRRGCALPEFPRGSHQDNAAQIAAQAQSGLWQPLPGPDEGAVVAIRIGPWVSHVGVALDAVRFIHAHKDVGIAVARLDDPRWANRIAGFYDWAGPCSSR